MKLETSIIFNFEQSWNIFDIFNTLCVSNLEVSIEFNDVHPKNIPDISKTFFVSKELISKSVINEL